MNVYPSPTRDNVYVEFQTNLFDTPVDAYLEVFNMNGTLVSSTAVSKLLSQGYYAGKLYWNGRSSSGTSVPPGVYLVALRASHNGVNTVKARQVVKLK